MTLQIWAIFAITALEWWSDVIVDVGNDDGPVSEYDEQWHLLNGRIRLVCRRQSSFPIVRHGHVRLFPGMYFNTLRVFEPRGFKHRIHVYFSTDIPRDFRLPVNYSNVKAYYCYECRDRVNRDS